MKSLKYLKYIVISGTIVLSIGNIAKGQYIPGTVDMMPSMNATSTNAITAARTRILSGESAAAERAEASRIKAIEQRGAQIIKAGKATTRFIPNPEVTKLTVKNLTFSAGEPQNLAGQIKWVRDYSNKFNELAKAAGLPINDYSDGYVLAVALSRSAYYDQKVSIKGLQQELEKNRQRILTSNYAQGMSNETKQIQYELYADMTVQALEFREQASQAKTPHEKAEAEQKAKRYAEYMLGEQ